ncbi:MAG: hypothetical protein RJB09_2239, partial [Pseudomonadota bacterium]
GKGEPNILDIYAAPVAVSLAAQVRQVACPATAFSSSGFESLVRVLSMSASLTDPG